MIRPQPVRHDPVSERCWDQIPPEAIRNGDVISADLDAGTLTVGVVDSSYSIGRGPIRGVWADPTAGSWADTGYSSRRYFVVDGPVLRRPDPSRPWEALTATLPAWQGCLVEIAHTGTTDRQWLAKELAARGLLRRACTDQCGHQCTHLLDCASHWTLTDEAVGVVRVLDPGVGSVPLDDWSLTGQMEIPI